MNWGGAFACCCTCSFSASKCSAPLMRRMLYTPMIAYATMMTRSSVVSHMLCSVANGCACWWNRDIAEALKLLAAAASGLAAACCMRLAARER